MLSFVLFRRRRRRRRKTKGKKKMMMGRGREKGGESMQFFHYYSLLLLLSLAYRGNIYIYIYIYMYIIYIYMSILRFVTFALRVDYSCIIHHISINININIEPSFFSCLSHAQCFLSTVCQLRENGSNAACEGGTEKKRRRLL